MIDRLWKMTKVDGVVWYINYINHLVLLPYAI